MQVLTPMTLYDSNGRGVTVYAPSTLGPPGTQQQNMPAGSQQPNASSGMSANSGANTGQWQSSPGGGGPTYTLAPMPQQQQQQPQQQQQNQQPNAQTTAQANYGQYQQQQTMAQYQHGQQAAYQNQPYGPNQYPQQQGPGQTQQPQQPPQPPPQQQQGLMEYSPSPQANYQQHAQPQPDYQQGPQHNYSPEYQQAPQQQQSGMSEYQPSQPGYQPANAPNTNNTNNNNANNGQHSQAMAYQSNPTGAQYPSGQGTYQTSQQHQQQQQLQHQQHQQQQAMAEYHHNQQVQQYQQHQQALAQQQQQQQDQNAQMQYQHQHHQHQPPAPSQQYPQNLSPSNANGGYQLTPMPYYQPQTSGAGYGPRPTHNQGPAQPSNAQPPNGQASFQHQQPPQPFQPQQHQQPPQPSQPQSAPPQYQTNNPYYTPNTPQWVSQTPPGPGSVSSQDSGPMPSSPMRPTNVPFGSGSQGDGSQSQHSSNSSSATRNFSSSQQSKSATNVYISNLPDSMSKDALRDLFSQYGTVLSCRVARKHGQCPIGFVQYTDSGPLSRTDMAQAAVNGANGLMLEDGRIIRVKLADHDKDKGVISGPSPDLYICNLPEAWSYAELHSTFSAYGRILSLTIFKESSTGSNIGSGMVRYSTTAEATTAIQSLNRVHLPGMNRPLEVKYAESRAEKDRRISSRMQCGEDKVDPSEETRYYPEVVPGRKTSSADSWSDSISPSPSNGTPVPPGPGQGQDLYASQQFSRLMNMCGADAKANGLPAPRCAGYEGFKSSDSSQDGITTDCPSSEDFGAARSPLYPKHGHGPEIGYSVDCPATFWDSVQGMLSEEAGGRESLSGPQGGGYAFQDWNTSSFNNAVDMAQREEKLAMAAMTTGNIRAGRNKRRQRRPMN